VPFRIAGADAHGSDRAGGPESFTPNACLAALLGRGAGANPDTAADADQLAPGDLVLFSGFGAGMAWASALLRWGTA